MFDLPFALDVAGLSTNGLPLWFKADFKSFPDEPLTPFFGVFLALTLLIAPIDPRWLLHLTPLKLPLITWLYWWVVPLLAVFKSFIKSLDMKFWPAGTFTRSVASPAPWEPIWCIWYLSMLSLASFCRWNLPAVSRLIEAFYWLTLCLMAEDDEFLAEDIWSARVV